jgi:hypothetical protein
VITETVQRWTERRESRRPAREVVSTRHLEAVVGEPDRVRAFVAQHHYAETCSSTAHPLELYDRGTLVGVAACGPSASMNVHRKVFPTLGTKEGVTLGRFVLLDQVAANAESWFIARSFELLRDRGVVAVESCADPLRGHVGTIYQATNGHYIGKTNPSTIRVFDDGIEFSNRASGKVRLGEVGRAYAIGQLVRRGAPRPYYDEDIREWLRYWSAELTRTARHRGKHRYLWCLDRRRRREVLRFPTFAYPKLEAA